MNMKKIGKNITTLRKSKGYTQDSLAEKLNISPQAISKWETGTGLPEASMLIELSELFDTSIDNILQPELKRNNITDFINRNLAAPKNKLLNNIPRISRWYPPEGCDMHYSMPAMITEALCCIEAYETGKAESVAMDVLNDRFRDLMHIMGIGYGFLWLDSRHMIEELWRINSFNDMVDRAMRYYGRDYLWLTEENTSPEQLRRIIIWSIDRGHPVVMENAAGVPEFNIVTGYEDNGSILIGYTYCEECAAKTNEQGMFVNPARWNEKFSFKVLIIGDKIDPSLNDKDTIQYALEVLNRKVSEDKSYEEYIAGDAALNKWLDVCDTTENAIKNFIITDIFTHALYQNSIYTQKCLEHYYKKLGGRNNRDVNGICIQIGIAIGRIESNRNGVESLKDKPDECAAAIRRHIESFIKHREHMRGWLSELIKLL